MLYKIPVLKSVKFQDFLKEEKIPFNIASADNQRYMKFIVSNFITKTQKTKINDFLHKACIAETFLEVF